MSNENADTCLIDNKKFTILDDSSVKLQSKYILCNLDEFQKKQ